MILPMFPLGLVHFPHTLLPLRVFEPRYRTLTEHCLSADREFGVVLIERGSEVGGGDSRFDIGTLTRILRAGLDPQGLIHLETLGIERLRVHTWLPDDPYPRAEVERLPPPVLGPSELEALAEAEQAVRWTLALRAELDELAVPYDVALDPDPQRAMFQLAAVAPLGALDRQRVLSALPAPEMLATLLALVSEEAAVLASRLGGK